VWYYFGHEKTHRPPVDPGTSGAITLASQQARVLVQLRDLILKGAFAPGERLAEIPIAQKLGASRTPVRLAFSALEQEGLVEPSPTGGYLIRRFMPQEIADAIAVRGHLEGMAARLVAEHGLTRQLLLRLQDCLKEGDRVLSRRTLDYDDCAGYIEMNDRFHQLIVDGAGNAALARAIGLNNRLPFASPSATLPMQQTSSEEGREWLRHAHRQHHSLVQAMEHGEGTRAQALAEEHVQIARMNMNYALERPEASAEILPAFKLVVEAVD
jgi:GntR family transcriptional regulator, vanillate catabolism transcriptional regulator